jgi:hypothetical protein
MDISLTQFDHTIKGTLTGPPIQDIDMEQVLNSAQKLFTELTGGEAYEVRFHMTDGNVHRFPVKTPMVSGGSVTAIDQEEGFTATTAKELPGELPAGKIEQVTFLPSYHPHHIIDDDPFFAADNG